jgi:tRNA A-37 threonylcarbamoyl transferase component Bud32
MKAGVPPVPVALAQGWDAESILRRLVLAYQQDKAERRHVRKEIAKVKARGRR